MARVSARRRPERERILVPSRQDCPGCGGHMRLRYENRRDVVTLSGGVRLRLRIRWCEREGCPRFHVPYRPEAEGAIALPQHEFGLDVIALVGAATPSRAPQRAGDPPALRARGVAIAERSVTNLLDRYDELLATADRQPPAARRAGGARAGHPGAGWLAARCRARGAVGDPRLPLGRGAAGAQPALRHGRGSGAAAARGGRRGGRAGAGGGQRRPDLDPPGGRAGAAGGSAPALPVSLPARGGAADLRGRPACQEGAEEPGPRRAADRAGGGGAGRSAGRGGAAATVPRCAAPSPTMAARRWRPRG